MDDDYGYDDDHVHTLNFKLDKKSKTKNPNRAKRKR